MEFIAKFKSIFTHGPVVYINAARVLDEYRKIKGCSKSTQITMIQKLGINEYIIVGRRGSLCGTIINIKIDDPKFKPSVMNVFIDINKIKNNNALVERIKNLPDVEQEEVNSEVSSEWSCAASQYDDLESVKSVAVLSDDLIQLQDHEQFRDMNGDVFHIEVRGDRTKKGIRFKAKDIERYFGVDRLVEYMMRGDRQSPYMFNQDFVIRGSYLPSSVGKITAGDYHKDDIYLTLQGLLQVIFTSKSGNENKDIMLDWIVGLVYTHKFGSLNERTKLAKKLTKDFSKHMLNKNISGLYYVDIGKLDDLYDTTNISRDQYPPETYGEHRIAKFGLATDIFKRVNDHRSTADGYGRWSTTIEHKWSVMMSESQLSKAEKHLSDMIKLSEFKFDYTDPFGKKHMELIIVQPSKECKIKEMYRKLLDLFPNKENELLKELASREEQYEAKEAKIKLEYERKLNKSSSSLNEARLIAKDHELARQDAEHRAEVLALKLQMAEMQLSK